MKKILLIPLLLLSFWVNAQTDAIKRVTIEWYSGAVYTAENPEQNFDSDYQAILTEASVQGYSLPTPEQQIKQNQLVLDLKAAGVWTLLDVLYVFANNGGQDFATLNWINPTLYRCIRNGTLTFTSNVGYQSDGTTGYLNAQFIPGFSGAKYTLNNAGVFHYVNNSASSNLMIDYGTRGDLTTSRVAINTARADLSKDLNLNSTQSITPVDAAGSPGFYLNTRSGSTAGTHILYKNGVVFDNSNAASSAMPTLNNFYICALNNNGSPGFYSTRQIGIVGLGSNMSGVQAALYTAWNTYRTSL